MNYEIIDFHTHPFKGKSDNICRYKEHCNMSKENTVSYLKGMGITKICGSVLDENVPGENVWERLLNSNKTALELAKEYDGFYIPGFHVHPDFVRESCEEIEKMSKLGVRLIGELCPYHDGWEDYGCNAFDEILDTAKQYNMIVSFHSSHDEYMDSMVKKHPDVILIAAHPGETESVDRHLKRMEWSDNYYLDLSGTGLFRHGMLRYGIDKFGAERFLFGSDYPVCNPAMFVGGVMGDSLLTDKEKEMVFSGNAKRLLGIEGERV